MTFPPRVVLVWAVLIAIFAGGGTAARGQLLSGAGSVGDETRGVTHGWVCVPDDDARGVLLLYLPPRSAPLPHGEGDASGIVSLAAKLGTGPVRIGASGDRLSMVFEESTPGFRLERRSLLSIRAVRDEVRGSYSALVKPRLDAQPTLPADGRLVAFGGIGRGLAALIQGRAGAEPHALELLILDGSKWRTVPLSREIEVFAARTFDRAAPATDAARYGLYAVPGGIGLLAAAPRSGEVRAWRARIGDPADAAELPVWAADPLPDGADSLSPGAGAEMVSSGGHAVLVSSGADGLVLHVRPETGVGVWREIARIPGAPARAAIVPLDGDGRVAVVWNETPPADAGRGRIGRLAPVRRVVEVSVLTGGVFFDGPARIAGPVSAADYRFMLLLLIYVVGMIALFVFRPGEPEGVAILPKGYALAEPTRRLVASSVDVILALLVASRVGGVGLDEALSPAAWVVGPGQGTLLLALGILIAVNSLMEATIGASAGKLLTGCEVAAVRLKLLPKGDAAAASTPRLSIGRSLLRNLIKWGLPPVALVGLIDPALRHRGDLFAGAAVVLRTQDEPPKPDPEE